MIRLRWLGHATVVVDVGGVRLVTDPLLRRHVGPLRRVGPPPAPAHWTGVDAVLVSHLHHDHAELRSLRKLPDAPILTGAVNAPWLARRVRSPVVPLVAGRWVEVTGRGGRVEVTAVRADHRNRPMPHRPNGAHGFLVRSEDEVVWFAGDTSLYDEMVELPRHVGRAIDAALVPIAGWGPRLSPGHLGPTEAAQACSLVQPRAVLPIHHGTLHPLGFQLRDLDWMQHPLPEFAVALAAAAPGCRLLDAPVATAQEVG